MGFSQKQSVFILYIISGLLGISAIVLAESGALKAVMLLACVLVVILISGLIHKKNSEDNSGDE